MPAAVPSLGPKLNSVKAKIRRADQHARALRQSLKRYRDVNPHTFGVEPNTDPSLVEPANLYVTFGYRDPLVLPARYERRTNVIVLDVFVTLRLRPPALRWGTMVGDIVHNLGSALDNLVWELARLNVAKWPSEPAPTASSRDRNAYRRKLTDVGFPYIKEREQWPDNVRRYLSLVDPSLHAIFEEAQPFYAWENARIKPDLHPLWVLHELWNRDKHRTVNLAASGAHLQDAVVQFPDLFPDTKQLKTERVKSFALRPIEGKTKVGVIRVHLPKAINVTAKVSMKVDANLPLGILFGQGSPAEGKNALEVLAGATKAAIAVINQFE